MSQQQASGQSYGNVQFPNAAPMMFPPPYYSRERSVRCNHCGKNGHYERNCWEKNGSVQKALVKSEDSDTLKMLQMKLDKFEERERQQEERERQQEVNALKRRIQELETENKELLKIIDKKVNEEVEDEEEASTPAPKKARTRRASNGNAAKQQ